MSATEHLIIFYFFQKARKRKTIFHQNFPGAQGIKGNTFHTQTPGAYI